jgi:hypothetical protein
MLSNFPIPSEAKQINNFKLVSAESLLKISNLVIHSGHKYLCVEEENSKAVPIRLSLNLM